MISARASRSAAGKTIAVVGLDEAAGGCKGSDPRVEGGGADAAAATQLGERERSIGVGESGDDALIERAWRRRHRITTIDDFEREGITALSKLDRHGRRGRGGAVLHRQGEIVAVAAQIEIGVAPSVELGRAAQRLPGTSAAGALLGVVDDEHGNGMASLQLAQIGQQRRHLSTGVDAGARTDRG